MVRMVILAAAIVAIQAANIETAWADEDSSLDPRDDMRGMFVLKLPFGGPEIISPPRVGLGIQKGQANEFDYRRNRHDSRTGRRLPELDTGSIRTWSVDDLDFSLPEDPRGGGESNKPNGRFKFAG